MVASTPLRPSEVLIEVSLQNAPHLVRNNLPRYLRSGRKRISANPIQFLTETGVVFLIFDDHPQCPRSMAIVLGPPVFF